MLASRMQQSEIDGVAMSHGGLFPAWYPFFCRTFDVVFGLYLMVRAGAWQDPR